jgi:hypothetical protein
MGQYVKEGNDLVYKQDNGEITAVLTDFEEKMELGHEGSSKVRQVFHLFLLLSIIYIAWIIFF